MPVINLVDRASYAIRSTRKILENGYLKVRARLARSGIQTYYGKELGLDGNDTFKLFSIYRPPELVFDEAILKSFNGIDITNGHPPVSVDVKNCKDYSKGVAVSEAVKEEDSDYIACDLLIKDRELINDIEHGKKEISLGYKTEIELRPGTTPDGTHYDGILTAIKGINHIAVVARGRAGGARLYDSLGEKTMKVAIGTVEVELSDEIGQEVQKQYEAIQAKVEDAEKKLSESETKFNELTSEKAKVDAEVEQLKAQLKDAQAKIPSDEDLKQRLENVKKATQDAQIIAGEKFVCDSLDVTEIKRAALTAAVKERDFKDASPEYVNAFFDAQLEFAKQGIKSRNAVKTAIKDSVDGDKNEPQNDPYEKQQRDRAEAWKKGITKEETK